MRISADQLIVDDVGDLRIVGTGYAAPGTHLPGLDPVDLWARRSIAINDLAGINFTVGSYRTLSILPIEILSFEADWKNQLALIFWKITLEGEVKIELFKSKKSVSNWEKVTEIRSGFDSKQEFHTFDPSASPYENTYYPLKITFQSQSKFSSKVIRLAPFFPIDSKIKISPNPYSSGPLLIQIPPEFELHETFVQVVLINGELIFESPYHSSEISEKLISLPKGLYIVRFFNDEKIQFIRWVHR
ncbi:T9SS type A sorting domain-containing protein [Algoriphagus sp. PAP.12]|uniref:T9SS type A sorting domain-containing protein n=1 Tax=Algoriphagus sp. PAP.12 TaxID=2996678 RepID=UPI00227C1146|nr:T9SS type A sorting domain-containing protein [Algoriphagus sp. PAP.12]